MTQYEKNISGKLKLMHMKCLNTLVLLTSLMTVQSSFAAELSIQYKVIAKSGVTPIPGGVGTFTDFSAYSAIDDDGNITGLF